MVLQAASRASSPAANTAVTRLRNGLEKAHQPLPRSFHVLAWIHCLCLLLCSLSLSQLVSSEALVSGSEEAQKACFHLPKALEESCVCSVKSDSPGVSLVCQGINSTSAFDVNAVRPGADSEGNDLSSANAISGSSVFPAEYRQLLWTHVRDIRVEDSHISTVHMEDFRGYKRLQSLSIRNCHTNGISMVYEASSDLPQFPELRRFDLSGNALSNARLADLSSLGGLKHVNLSGNALTNIPSFLAFLAELESLDLSDNKLDEAVDETNFKSLPKTIRYLDISNNTWSCSPRLAWLYSWSVPLRNSNILKNLDKTRCRYVNSHHSGPLLLVMEYYSRFVIPACPRRDECTCLLTWMQEVLIKSTERKYKVQVDCAGHGLKHFPKLPKHTSTVDLTGNQLDSHAFSILKVSEHNYDEVDNLTLDNNLLDTLPEKLLEMNLAIGFSATSNRLTSIPYDFSQRLVKTTAVIKLSDNPWHCTCRSQITDLNLLAKIRDRSDLTCGPGSELLLVKKRIENLNAELLCPPESNGEAQELLLQLLCLIFAILILVILSKLAYDYWLYRTRGQLPWIVLKMP